MKRPSSGFQPHADAVFGELKSVPLDAAVERVGQLADLLLLGRVAVVELLREEDPHHQQRRVDRRELGVPVARAVLHVEEVVEEAPAAGRAGGLRPLRGVQEKAERRERPLGGLLAGDVAALDADAVGREPEPDGGDAGEGRVGRTVGDEPVRRVRRLPEPGERPRLHVL